MNQEQSIQQEGVWNPESGLPPPMTAEYGFVEQDQDPFREQLRDLHMKLVEKEIVDEENKVGTIVSSETDKIRDYIDSKEILTQLRAESGNRYLTKEEREKVLSPEVLSSLDTKEYIELWRHLSPHYASHVTRQGYRENYYEGHFKGVGEFHDNFASMLANGKSLKSPMGVEGISNDSELKKELSDLLDALDVTSLIANDDGTEHYPNPWDKIKTRLRASWGSAPNVPDEMAVHLATDRVLDKKYGGETDNQVFTVYPADMIASQYHFAFNGEHLGQSFDQQLPEGEEKWNDVFVWDKGDAMRSALPLDAGIVFLPRSTEVDRRTGSKYVSYKTSFDDSGKRVIEAEQPSDPIAGEAYWSNYFDEHPELKPKHVVFYDGDPTTAVRDFMKENNILSQSGTEDEAEGSLGFEEHHISDMKNDPRTEAMEQNALRLGAIALIEYFDRHPDVSPNRLMRESDIAEIRSLVDL